MPAALERIRERSSISPVRRVERRLHRCELDFKVFGRVLSLMLQLFRHRRAQFVAACLGISAVVWFSYARILELGFTGWDTLTLLEWSHRNLSRSVVLLFTKTLMPGLPYYRPTSNLSYGIDFMAWGTMPAGYHLVDIFLHWATCLGVLVLGVAVTGRVAIGALAGLLLALHPTFGIIVANIAYRQDVLVTLAVVWCLVFTNSFLNARSNHRLALRVGAWLAFALAVGSKEVGIIALPLALARITYPARGRVRRAVVESLPFLVVAAGYLFLHFRVTPRNLVPPIDLAMWNVWLPFVYLQELVFPEPGLVRFGSVGLLVFGSAAAFLLAYRWREAALRFWLLLWAAWILLAVGVYIATNFQEFVDRYAYIIAPPFFLLLATALFTAFPSRPPLLRRAGYAAQIALVGILLLWLPAAPLRGLPEVWWQREVTTDAYLQEFDRMVAQLPPAAVVELENVPPKWMYLDSLKTWLALKWADKQIRITRQTAARKPQGKPTLSLQRTSGAHEIVIHATYLTED
jgi:hypothetical protein